MKKTLSLLLALAMVLTLFAGVAQASANVSIGSIQRVVTPGADFPLVRINIRSAAQEVVSRVGGDRTIVRVTLPSGVIWTAPPALANVATTFQGEHRASAVSGFARESDNRTAVFTVTSTVAVDMISFSGISVDITNNDLRGAINAEVVVRNEFVDSVGAIITAWEQTTSVPIANVVAAGTLVTPREATNVIRGAADQAAGSIRIEESIARSFATSSVITLTPPAGVTFTGTAAVATTLPGTGIAIATAPGSITVTTTNALSVNPGRIDITGIRLNIGPTVADGPINITVRGTNVDGTAAVATVGVVGLVTPSSITAAADLATINAGRLDERVSGIRFTENMADAFLGNRVLTLTLPAGFTWNGVATPAWAVAAPAISDDDRTLTFWTRGTTTPEDVNRFNLIDIDINTHITAPAGDIVVTVGGNTGATGTVTVARLRRPVTVTAVTAPNVRADSLGQSLGSLIITEAHQGALLAGKLTIALPAGTSLVGASVAVADVAGTEPTVTGVSTVTGNTISLSVAAPATAATNPTTVTVSGISINLDRVPVGTPITATVAGTAILEAGADAGLSGTDVAAARGTVVAEAVLGNVISRTARRTVFTIDATNFTVDGVTQPALDVAPVIQAGRTMMPIRAAANAAGVTNDNILFEAGVITIIRGDRIAQFTLGSRVMVVNGVAMNMDVAPALVAGRALIPVRWVGTALGVPVVWDATARTVTVSVQ